MSVYASVYDLYVCYFAWKNKRRRKKNKAPKNTGGLLWVIVVIEYL